MSQKIYTNFDYKGTLPNFKRDSYKTLEAMAAVSDTVMPAMLLGYCEETGQVYLYNKENDVDEATGKWRLLQSGGGSGAVDSVNGKTGAVILRAADIKLSDKTTSIQTKLDTIVNNTSVSAEEGNTLEQKSDGLYVPETVGGVSSVNTKTGVVVLTGEDINTSSDESSKTIKEDIKSKQDKITTTNKLDYSLLDNTPEITTVIANPAKEATKALSKLTVGDTVYSVSGGEGAVTSVNELTGDVVLTAENVNYNDTTTIKAQIDNVENKTIISDDTNSALIRDANNKLSVPLSTTNGNTLVKKDDGLYVPTDTITSVNTKTGDVVLTGEDIKVDSNSTTTLKIYSAISAETGNSLVRKDDGLYVGASGVEISAESGNLITQKDDGLYANITFNSEIGITVYAYFDTDADITVTETGKTTGDTLSQVVTVKTPMAIMEEEYIKITTVGKTSLTGKYPTSGWKAKVGSSDFVTLDNNVKKIFTTNPIVTSVNGNTGDIALTASDIKDSNDKTIQTDINTLTTASTISTDTDNSLIRGTDDGLYVKVDYPVTSVNGNTGDVTLTASDINTTSGKTIQAELDDFTPSISAETNNTIEAKTDGLYSLKAAEQNLTNGASYYTWINNGTSVYTSIEIAIPGTTVYNENLKSIGTVTALNSNKITVNGTSYTKSNGTTVLGKETIKEAIQNLQNNTAIDASTSLKVPTAQPSTVENGMIWLEV